jgi:predicted ATPase
MKFEFYNIGCIEKVELELKPFTLIAGLNQTGKSFILKCIYGILGADKLSIVKIVMEKFENIESMNEADLENARNEFYKMLEKLFVGHDVERVKKEFNKVFQEWIKDIKKGKKLDVDDKILLFLMLQTAIQTIKHSFIKNRINLQKKLKWIFQQENLGDIVNKFSNSDEGIIKIITGENDEYIIKILKDRDEIKTNKDELILDMGWANYISSPIILDLEKGIATYREDNPDNYGIPDIYWDILKDIRNKGKAEEIELIDIYKKIEDIIGGRFDYEMGKGFVYKRGDKEFHINLVAYGIKIFGIIQMLIERNLITKGSVLILEEPEVHLHPSLRFKLVDLLKDLANAGVYVIISTHSPEIVRYVEYLINTKKMDINDCSFLHLKLNEKILTSYGKSKSNYKELNEILKSLTEDYFEIVIKEELEMEE